MACRCMGRLLPNLLQLRRRRTRRRRRGMARAEALVSLQGRPHRPGLQRWLRGGRSSISCNRCSSSCSSCHWRKLQPYSCCLGDQCGMLQLMLLRLLMLLLMMLQSLQLQLLLPLLGGKKVSVHLHRMVAPLLNVHPPLLMLACLFLGLFTGSRSGTSCPGDTFGRVPPIGIRHCLRPPRFGAQALPRPPRLEPKWLRTL